MNYKGIALLLCQAKGDTLGVCLKKLCVSTPENLMRVFITMDQRWGSYVLLKCNCSKILKMYRLKSRILMS